MASTGTTHRNNVVGLPDELADLIISICEAYEKEGRDERQEKISLWTKLENYFNGFQRRYWNMVALDWRRLPEDATNETARHYDKIINIYRAHAEAIIAALAVKLPSAIFYPLDADIEEDVTTAKVCTKIKEIIERHNEAKLLFLKALMILFNQGTVAAYIYNRKNSSYGTYKKPKYSDKTVERTTVLLNCPECGNNVDEIIFKGDEAKKIPEEEKKCSVCGLEAIPDQEEYIEELPELLGYTDEAKSRTKIEVFSPLFVHMPFYARNQETMPYLKLEFEQHFSLLKEIYPKLDKKTGISPGTVDQSQEERGIYVESRNNLVTTKCWWVRPWAYNVINPTEEQKKLIKKLKEKYPDGFYAVILDRNLAEVHNENLDDHWSVSENPLSTYIHGEPLGKPLAPIQDLFTEVTDLQIETFEHSIPETFIDAKTISFKAYKDSQAAPGMIFPAKMPDDGSNLSSRFHTLKTATLSEETDVFQRRLEDKGQFVVGSFPSIYGGPATSGSKTAKEYTESRAMALQRLSIPWNIVKFWWARTSGKAVMQFIHAMKQTDQDYKDVIKKDTGFINNWIRQTDIQGSVGDIQADAEEDLPMSAAQMKDIVVQLMSLKDPAISAALQHPQNTKFVTKALGNPDFFIPNNDDREKQYAEFADLLNGLEVEVKDWDNHGVESEVCRTFLIDEVGRILKRDNPEGWARIEEHMLAHMEKMAQKAQEPAPVAENTVPEGA